MQITYSKFEHELNRFLKKYLDDNSFDDLEERLNLPETKTDSISEKINEFYQEQLQIDKYHSKDRIRIDRIITFSEKSLKPEKFTKFLIEIARVCLSEGKLDLANEIFRKANNSSDSNDLTKAESLLGLADVFSRRANWTRSLNTISKANSLFKSLNDKKGMAKCENLNGTIWGELGEVAKAKKHFLTSLSLIDPGEDIELAANLYTNLGIVYNIQENSKDSIKHLKRALSLYNKIGKYKNAAEVNLNIGLVYFDIDSYEDAIAALDNAIETAKQGGYLSVLCLTYLAKSQVLIKLRNYFYAAEFADKALELSHNSDDKLTVADIYKVKGIIERLLENYVAAETYLLNSLRINNSLNNELNAAETSYELGLLYEEMNNSSSKDSHLKQSLEYFKNIDAPKRVERIEELLGLSSAL